MAIQKMSYSPSNLRTIKQPLIEMAVPTIFFGMPPLPLIKGVNNATSIGLNGVSNGSTKIISKQTSSASAQSDGTGSIKGLDFGRQNGRISTVNTKRSNKRAYRGKTKATTEKKKVSLRKSQRRVNGRFAK